MTKSIDDKGDNTSLRFSEEDVQKMMGTARRIREIAKVLPPRYPIPRHHFVNGVPMVSWHWQR